MTLIEVVIYIALVAGILSNFMPFVGEMQFHSARLLSRILDTYAQ